MRYLSVCARFKNETKWLAEWLNYHIQVGVEHFYLYNDDDDPRPATKILQPYIARGFVTLLDNRMAESFRYIQHSFTEYGKDTNWLAVIDLDEFILPRSGFNDIPSVLANYEQYSGLSIHWLVFGSSGLTKSPPDQINHFLYRSVESFPNNRNIKTISRPACVGDNSHNNHPEHLLNYHTGYAVNEKHERVVVDGEVKLDDVILKNYTGDIIRINHYRVRSREDFDSKCKSKLAFDTTVFGFPYESYWKHENLEGVYYIAAINLNNDQNVVYDNEISVRFGTGTVQKASIRFPNDFCKVVLHAPHRTDRVQLIEKLQEQVGDLHIVDVVPNSEDILVRHFEAFKTALDIALASNKDYIVYFEDDCVLAADAVSKINETINTISDWDFIYATWHEHENCTNAAHSPFFEVEGIATDMHCLLIKRAAATQLLNEMQAVHYRGEQDGVTDVWVSHFIERYKLKRYLMFPKVAKDMGGHNEVICSHNNGYPAWHNSNLLKHYLSIAAGHKLVSVIFTVPSLFT